MNKTEIDIERLKRVIVNIIISCSSIIDSKRGKELIDITMGRKDFVGTPDKYKTEGE